MKAKFKKILCTVMAVALIICSVPIIQVSAAGWSLAQMQASFPHGKYWNHLAKTGHTYAPNAGWVHYGDACGDIMWSVTDHPCYSHNAIAPVGQYDCNTYYNKATQCSGFAQLMADLAYEGSTNIDYWSQTTNKSTAISVVKPGDVIHYKGAGADATWGHWAFVIGVSGSTVTLGECGVDGNCKISWGRTLNLNNVTSITLYRAPSAWDGGTTTYYLDVNGLLDNAASGSISGFGTCDVYMNGSLVANDVSDFYTAYKAGTTYEIKDIKATACHLYTGKESYSGTLNSAVTVQLSFETAHIYDFGTVTKEATCTDTGTLTYSCVLCGSEKTKAIDALGHEYVATYINPTCTENAKEIYTCTRCFDTYEKELEAQWSDWQTTKPDVDGAVIETKTQYRYSDKETKLAATTQLDGWDFVGVKWSDGEKKSVSYVASWPAGFDRNNSLYSQYNNTAPTEVDTDTKKIVLGSTTTQGYIYWHWCSSYYNGSEPINRLINDYYTEWEAASSRPYNVFHAFYSTEYKAVSASAGAVNYYNSGACNQTYWWQPAIPVLKTEYTEYNLLCEFTRNTDYTDWSDEVAVASDTRTVQTRTVYRYSTSDVLAKGHSWDEGRKIATGDTVYVCTDCGETSTVQMGQVNYTLGDVNADGKVNALDARLTLRASAKLEVLDQSQQLAADVNIDGKVNALDARKILRVSARLEEL